MDKDQGHYPIEIFGFPIWNRTKIAVEHRNSYMCPFLEGPCKKQSRLLNYPMGICSVLHSGSIIPICPHRLLQDAKVFVDVCNDYFGDTNNILVFSEVKLRNIGTFDFVLVKHKPISNKIEDFCVIEIQTDSTTGTGALVNSLKDYIDGKDITKTRYSYGMNTYNTIKLSFTQMMIKGQVFEKWKRKIYWIEPLYVFENMIKRFNLYDLEYNKNDSNVFFTYDLIKHLNIYELKRVYSRSSSVSNILTAFSEQFTPEIDVFIKHLEDKIEKGIGVRLE